MLLDQLHSAHRPLLDTENLLLTKHYAHFARVPGQYFCTFLLRSPVERVVFIVLYHSMPPHTP